MTQAPERIDAKRADVPTALADLVMRCLAKSPDERPASAGEVLAALANVSMNTSVNTPTTPRSFSSNPSASRTRVLVAGVVAAALIGAGFVATRRLAAPAAGVDAPSIDHSRVLIAAPAGESPALNALAMQAADAIARALGTVASIRHVETLPSGKSDAAALERARGESDGTLLTATVAAVGRDSARFRFQIVDAQTGQQVRTLAVDMPNTPDDAGLRAALDPVLSTLLFVSYPSMGAATLPLGTPPRFEATRELATRGLDIGATAVDSVSRDAALPHYLRAAALDSTFVGARLPSAGGLHSVPLLHYVLDRSARAIGDTIMLRVTSAPTARSVDAILEHAYYDVIVAVHLGQVAGRGRGAAAPSARWLRRSRPQALSHYCCSTRIGRARRWTFCGRRRRVARPGRAG